MENIFFKNKKINHKKLRAFGFILHDGVYIFEQNILDNGFKFIVEIAENGKAKTKTLDLTSNEVYTLHLSAAAAGLFVGKIREEYENILNLIAEKCFDVDIYKNLYIKKIIEYINKKYDDKLEFLWEKSPTSSIIRRKDTKKWYAVLMIIQKNRLIAGAEGVVEAMNLRAEPDNIKAMIDNKIFFPGFHMNKKHWFTISFDALPEALPNEKGIKHIALNEIFKLVDSSYELAVK